MTSYSPGPRASGSLKLMSEPEARGPEDHDSLDRPYLHVTPGRILDRREPARARRTRRHLGAGLGRQPLVPVVPPRAGEFLGARPPFVERRRVLGRLVQPVLVLL